MYDIQVLYGSSDVFLGVFAGSSGGAVTAFLHLLLLVSSERGSGLGLGAF